MRERGRRRIPGRRRRGCARDRRGPRARPARSAAWPRRATRRRCSAGPRGRARRARRRRRRVLDVYALERGDRRARRSRATVVCAAAGCLAQRVELLEAVRGDRAMHDLAAGAAELADAPRRHRQSAVQRMARPRARRRVIDALRWQCGQCGATTCAAPASRQRIASVPRPIAISATAVITGMRARSRANSGPAERDAARPSPARCRARTRASPPRRATGSPFRPR